MIRKNTMIYLLDMTMNKILQEIKKFSLENWWIYIIFIICIFIIWYTNTGNIFEISIIFFLHFLWDIFMMMMWDYYAQNNKKQWGIYQILSMSVFTLIAVYAFIFNGKINYLISQILFWMSSLKAYLDMKESSQKILNYKMILCVGIMVIWGYIYFDMIHNFSQYLQIIWFTFFAAFLAIHDKKIQYFWSLGSIFLIFLSSGIETYYSFLLADIKWIDISFFLLPLTVFIFYLKNIKKYLW